MRGGTGVLTSEDTSPVHPVCGPGAACSHSPVAASHGWSGPAPRTMVGLGRVSGPHPRSGMAAYRCAGVSGARARAPPAPLPRPLLPHDARLPCGHGAAPDDPRWGKGGLQVPREPPRQVLIRVGALLERALQSAIHNTEGGYEVLVRARGGGGWSPSAAVSHRCAQAAALRGSWRSCSSRWLRSSHAKSLAGACGGGSRPPRSLPAGRIGLWRGAAPQRPRAPVRSRTPPSTWRLRSATRPPTGPCPLVGGGGPPRAPPGGSGARGAASGCSPRACAPGSLPGRRRKGTARDDGDAGEPLLPDAEPALHRRVAVSGPQRPAVGGRRGEVPGVDVGRGVGRA